jgi:hypothetical protein
MFICMRTTLYLDDHVLKQAKLVAQQTGVTLTAFVEDALRERLARHVPRSARERVRLPTSKGNGLLPGVDLDDSGALRDLMDGIA